MNKKIKISLIILLIAFAIIFFMQKVYKTKKIGNNINKSTSDLLEYILNISSYEATAKVTINSNKTSNEYVIKQYYLKPIYSKQIIKEPQSIENLEILHNGKDLSIKNTNLGLSKIYQNYNYINENILWLNYFLDNCNENGYQIEENNEEIIIKNEVKKDKLKGNLYINKKNGLPQKIQILDNSNNTKIYIEYKEIKLNNIRENNIFALKTNDIKNEV